jgi:hypothetical protein
MQVAFLLKLIFKLNQITVVLNLAFMEINNLLSPIDYENKFRKMAD